ncbi:MAG: hypothetical protein CML19_04240 [Pusillimonas sp.]|nr:hypothetical protein [Pusillimonas sp.]
MGIVEEIKNPYVLFRIDLLLLDSQLMAIKRKKQKTPRRGADAMRAVAMLIYIGIDWLKKFKR